MACGACPDGGEGHSEGSGARPPDSQTRGGGPALPCGPLGLEPTPGWTPPALLSSGGRPRLSCQHPTPPPCLLQSQVQSTKGGGSRACAHSAFSTPGQRVPRQKQEDRARRPLPGGNVPSITSHFSSKNRGFTPPSQQALKAGHTPSYPTEAKEAKKRGAAPVLRTPAGKGPERRRSLPEGTQPAEHGGEARPLPGALAVVLGGRSVQKMDLPSLTGEEGNSASAGSRHTGRGPGRAGEDTASGHSPLPSTRWARGRPLSPGRWSRLVHRTKPWNGRLRPKAGAGRKTSPEALPLASPPRPPGRGEYPTPAGRGGSTQTAVVSAPQAGRGWASTCPHPRPCRNEPGLSGLSLQGGHSAP